MPNDAKQYCGNELELFRDAVNWKRYFASRLKPYLGQRVLEVGAGLGTNTRVLCTNDASDWTCLEPDLVMATNLRKDIAAGLLPGCCSVVTGTTEQLGSGEKFDTILYLDVLEHIEDDRGELERAAAHLATDGYLVVLAPAYQWLFSPFDVSIGHYRRYTRRSLNAITPVSARLVGISYLDVLGVFLSLANAAILRRSEPSRQMLRVWDRFIIPMSRIVDPITLRSVGRSIVAIWRKELVY